jgi:hypothetical protein
MAGRAREPEPRRLEVADEGAAPVRMHIVGDLLLIAADSSASQADSLIAARSTRTGRLSLADDPPCRTLRCEIGRAVLVCAVLDRHLWGIVLSLVFLRPRARHAGAAHRLGERAAVIGIRWGEGDAQPAFEDTRDLVGARARGLSAVRRQQSTVILRP